MEGGRNRSRRSGRARRHRLVRWFVAPAVSALAIALVACDDSSANPRDRPASTTTTAAPAAPSRADAIAAIDDACRRFLAGDAQLDRSGDADDALHRFIDGRIPLIEQAQRDVERIEVPPTLTDLRTRIGQMLDGALVLYRGHATLAGPDLRSIRDQAEDLVRQSAVLLYQNGAHGCSAGSPAGAAAPISPQAGRLLDIEPTATIVLGPPGIDDNRIVADRDGVWVGLRNANRMLRIDPGTNKVVADIDLGASPSGKPAIVDGYVWIDTPVEVIRIDPATNRIDRRFPRTNLGFGGAIEAAFSSDAVSTCAEGILREVSPVDGSPVRQVAVGVPCVGVRVDGGEMWLNLSEGGVARVDPDTGRVLRRVHLPNTWFYAAGSGTVRWAVSTDDSILRFDADDGRLTGTVDRTIEVLQGTVGGGAVWLTSADERRVLRVDESTMELTEIEAGDGANALAYVDGTLWVANSDAGTVMRFDVGDLSSG